MDYFKDKLFSVSESLAIAKELLQEINLTILGEVCEVKDSRGYKAVYFSIKDERSKLPCLMWHNIYDNQDVVLEEGMLVELTGRFSLYDKRGTFNFSATSIKLAGEGKLRAQVEQLKNKLELEGLFNEDHKKPIPEFPTRLGLITSGAGAVVHDVIRTIKRHSAGLEIIFYGVGVEGSSAASNMVEGLKTLDKESLSAILLVRGGGSYEDLMPFNDEELVRTIFDLKTPIITGVGHEPDTTLVDYVADRCASTPTAAAEMAIEGMDAVSQRFLILKNNLNIAVKNRIGEADSFLKSLENSIIRHSPTSAIDTYSMQLDYAIQSMVRLGDTMFDRHENSLTSFARRLEDLSPLSSLSRGYAYVKDGSGHVVKDASKIDIGEQVDVVFAKSSMLCKVEEIREE